MTSRPFDGPTRRSERESRNTWPLALVIIAGIALVGVWLWTDSHGTDISSLRGFSAASGPDSGQTLNLDPLSTANAIALRSPTGTVTATPTITMTASATPQTYCKAGLKAGTLCQWAPEIVVRTPIPMATCSTTPNPGSTCMWTEQS